MLSTSQRQIRVLHVDDDPGLTEVLATSLQCEGDQFATETATDADEGLRVLAETDIDCVVSNYRMPGTDGIEFFKSVTEEYPDLPFILYTGEGSEKVASDAIGAGVTDYLQKKSDPDHYTVLANRIINAVDDQRRHRRGEFFKTLRGELTELSVDFLRSDINDTDGLINHTLKRLGTLVGADRTYVFGVDSEAEALSNTHEWCSEGAGPRLDPLQDIPRDTLPWCSQQLKDLEGIVVPDVSEIPSEAEAEREILQKKNIKSFIIIPMVSDDELVGVIGFDWLEEQEAWSDEFVDILWTASELVTTAHNRKEREGELRELKSQYETLAKNFPDGAVFLIDRNLRYVRAGGEELNKVGLSPDDIEDIKPHALFPDDVADELCHYYEEALNGNANTFEQVYRGDCYQIQTVPVRTDEKSVDHVMAVSRNVTERKQQVEEIQGLKSRLELAIEGAEIGVWDWNMETDEVEFNDQWAEMLGYTLEELEPHLRAWETRVHPDDIEGVRASLDAHIQKNTEYYDTEHRMRTADGEWKWIRDIGKIVDRDGDGEPIRAVGIHLDVDETKQYQQELEQKTERLEEFAGIVSHDLRNPLTVAAGNLELARDDCESPHLEAVERAHNRMEVLIEDLLTLAREGETVTDANAVSLTTVVEESWKTVETAEASLTVNGDRTVLADEPRLKQLFENLIRNAVEHGGSAVTVTVGGLEDGFYVEDDGPGISEADAESLFEVGYSTNNEGSGFGLSIVQRIVEAHGWEIRVTNGHKGGARFEITDVEIVTE